MFELFAILRVLAYAGVGIIAVKRQMWWAWAAVTVALITNIIILSGWTHNVWIFETVITLAAFLLAYACIRRR